MRIDFDAVLIDIFGNKFSDGATLKDVCVQSMLTPLPGDERQTGADKLPLFYITEKVAKGGIVELSTDEIVKLKDRVGRAHSILTVGAAFRLLETVAP